MAEVSGTSAISLLKSSRTSEHGLAEHDVSKSVSTYLRVTDNHRMPHEVIDSDVEEFIAVASGKNKAQKAYTKSQKKDPIRAARYPFEESQDTFHKKKLFLR